MVGSAILHTIKKNKSFNVINCNRKDLDLTNQSLVDKWFQKNKPEIVINAAGRVGGILDNSTHQSDYLYTNAMIGLNLINSSLKHEIKQFINLGSACIYPKKVNQPIKEDSLLSSQLEKSNEGYAIAKITCLKYCQYLKEKYNISVGAHISSIKDIEDKKFNPLGEDEKLFEEFSRKEIPVIDDEKIILMKDEILKARENCNSIGGTIECIVNNISVGFGFPFF